MGPVIVGVDPHKKSVTIEAIDEASQVLTTTGRFDTTSSGYRLMLKYVRDQWLWHRWAVEGARGGQERPRHLLDVRRRHGLRRPRRCADPVAAHPEEAFDAWRGATRGRPVDYTGLTYGKPRGRRIAWPVNEAVPEGTDRLYTDPVFPTDTDQCQTYGHDLLTGGAVTEQEHRALAPAARAFLKGCVHTPSHQEPSED